LIVGKT